MKKLILSAAFALACFTAQAKNEVIKNDDDKNPKSKVKVVKVEVTSPGWCTEISYVSLSCPDGPTVVGAVRSASTCKMAKLLADLALWGATC